MSPSVCRAAQIPNASPAQFRVPPATAGMYSIRRGNRRERIRHPELASVIQDQCMVIVKTAPRRLDKVRSRILGRCHLTHRWRPAELHEEAVRCVAKRTLTFVHPSTVSPRPSALPAVIARSKGTH